MKTKPHPFARLTPEDKDSLVLSAIIGQAEIQPTREIKPALCHDNVFRSRAMMNGWGHCYSDGPCCAVGAAILFKNLAPIYADDWGIPRFAEAYATSQAYACGVSVGFERELRRDTSTTLDPDDPDFDRGFQVGKAAFEALHGGGA